MASLNAVTLMGNVTREIELKYTPNGTALARLGLAMNRKWKDSKTNQLKEEVTFVDVTVWGKAAETAQKYLAKGRLVLIQGRLQLESWIDKQTNAKRSKLTVVCERLTLLPSKDRVQGAGGGVQGAAPADERPVIDEPCGDLEIDEASIPNG